MDGLGAPAFVGRDDERRWLAGALARETTRLLVIEGEAGIGKSRFLKESLQSPVPGHEGILVLRCPPISTPFPLGTLVEALAQAPPSKGRLGQTAGPLRSLFPEWSDMLPEPLPPAESAAAERHRLFRALDELLRALDVRTVVLDDAHWADDATHDFLLHLASIEVAAPIRVVETWRSEERPSPELLARTLRIASGATGQILRLGPLDRRSAEQLIGSMLPGPGIPPRLAHLLHQRAQGVPLLLEDLTRTLHAHIRTRRGEEHLSAATIEALAPPAGLRESVASRMERLTPPARKAAWALAVLAEPAALPLLATVADLDHRGAGKAVDELQALHLVSGSPDGVISFRHGLVLEAVAERVPHGERSRLHARAAEALGAQPLPPVVRLARHLKQSGDIEGWARHAESVADLALRRADDPTAAAILLELAIGTVQPAVDLTRIVAKIPFMAFRSVEQYRAVEHVLRRTAEDVALSRLDQGRLRWQLARMLVVADQTSEAAEEIERAIPLLADDPLLVGQAMISLTHLSWSQWSSTTRATWLRQASGLLHDRDPASELRLVSDLATVLLRFGSADGWTEAAKIPTGGIDVRDRLNVARALGNICHCALVWGRFTTARENLAAAFDLARTYDYPMLLAGLEAMSLHLDYWAGSWDGLRQRAAAFMSAGRGVAGERLEAEIVEARLLTAEGDTAGAARRLRLVLGHPASRLGPEVVMEAHAVLGEIALADGDTDGALAVTEEPFALIERTGVWLWGADLVRVRVRALLRNGDRARAREAVEAMAVGVAGTGAAAADAALLCCRAMSAGADGDHAGARRLHRRAAAAWREIPRPHDELRALEAAARALPDDRGQKAVAELRGVRRGYARLGAVADAERVAGALRSFGGGREQQRRGRKGYGASLSPREQEVVRLIAAGETDTAIAARLFKSPNTIHSQVRSAKRKLGVSTRAELARAVLYPSQDEGSPSGAARTAGEGRPPVD